MARKKKEIISSQSDYLGSPHVEIEKGIESKKSDHVVPPGGIFIREVRIRNYRCLRSVDVELEDLTILIGQNNCGKTSFLNALFAAIGAGQRVISNDDIFLHKLEVAPPKERAIAIDILLSRSSNSA